MDVGPSKSPAHYPVATIEEGTRKIVRWPQGRKRTKGSPVYPVNKWMRVVCEEDVFQKSVPGLWRICRLSDTEAC